MSRLRTAVCFGTCLLLAGCVQSINQLREMAGKPVVHDTNVSLRSPAFVACREAAVHQNADRWSPRQAVLPFGTQVMPLDYAGFYPLANSQQGYTTAREMGHSAPERTMGASWVKVGTPAGEGWVANACLVDGTLMARQDPNGQLRVAPGTVAMRGFSEAETADLMVMRGGVGAAAVSACKSGCKGQEQIDRLIASTAGTDALEAGRAFRSTGRLGEYK